MKWFKHDTDAHRDAKVAKVLRRYGVEGYGLYWYCIELIAGKIDRHNLTFELEHDAELIAYDLKIDSIRVEEIMKYMISLGLFERSGTTITCLKIAKRLDTSMTGSPEMRQIIHAINTEKRPKCHDTIMTCHDTIMTLPDSVSTDKKRREENNNVHLAADERFKSFWDAYPRKEAKKKSEVAFKRLSVKKQHEAIAGLTGRFEGMDRRYVMLPTTYLNGERWHDECGGVDPETDLAGAI